MTWCYIWAPINHEVALLKKVIKKCYWHFHQLSHPTNFYVKNITQLLPFMYIYLNTENCNITLKSLHLPQQQFASRKDCYWFVFLNQANKIFSLTDFKFWQVKISQLVNSKLYILASRYYPILSAMEKNSFDWPDECSLEIIS